MQSGAVHVFAGSESAWSQTAVLTSPNASFQGLFGRSVAVVGNTALVGAPGERRMYVFERVPT